ncbi:sulfite exporter TauE/SafE family protein [Aestuariispira ectoiniformans]|uniref:sulfite exporter TauE/SafE family protein n=1 Tax=Aestuariispira ectoiniformans TaxID=2775080 RepID=UPI00223ABCA3|nr:sulfite exporter TauE/SafE family protein [Aestuariispira ectoiniformans]
MMIELPYLFFVAASAGASVISAVFGFGTAMVVLAVGSMVLPVKESIALATIIFTSNTLIKTWLYRREIDWPLAIWMSLASLPFAFLGAEVMVWAPVNFMQTALGILVLVYVAMQLWKPHGTLPLSKPLILGASGLYGFLSGLLGTGNVIKAIFLQRAGLERHSFVGVMAATSVLANLAKLGAYSQAGLLTLAHWPAAVGLVAVSLVSTVAGRAVLHRVNSEQFRIGVLVILTGIAATLLIGGR